MSNAPIEIALCTSMSCVKVGAEDLVAHVQKSLGIRTGETTADGQFRLTEIKCFDACSVAPTGRIGDKYYKQLTPDKLDRILKKLE
jgi:NADH-quinone oxidoreductase subunit E